MAFRQRPLGDVLRRLRDDANLEAEELEARLSLGRGWVTKIETDANIEPPHLRLLDEWARELNSSLLHVIEETHLESIHPLSDYSVVQEDEGLRFRFRYGRFNSQYLLPSADISTFETILTRFRQDLADGAMRTADSIVGVFDDIITTWPIVNPSDVWYFIIPRLFESRFNHPSEFSAGKDLSQSWKRSSGWALEQMIVDHYREALALQNIRLVQNRARQATLLQQHLPNLDLDVDKVDLLLVHNPPKVRERVLGVLHVKASVAERRNDIEQMSRVLMENGLVSSFVTMDGKAFPAEFPVNLGEFGSSFSGLKGEQDTRNVKRLEIEQQGLFDACYTFNKNTKPTPDSLDSVARIVYCELRGTGDALLSSIVQAV